MENEEEAARREGSKESKDEATITPETTIPKNCTLSGFICHE